MALACSLPPKNPVDPVQLPYVEEPGSLCVANQRTRDQNMNLLESSKEDKLRLKEPEDPV